MRGFGLAVLTVAFLGLSGCGADNETTATQLQGAQGSAPTPENAKPGEVSQQASSYEQYAKQQRAGNSDPTKNAYSDKAKKK